MGEEVSGRPGWLVAHGTLRCSCPPEAQGLGGAHRDADGEAGAKVQSLWGWSARG